VGIEAQSSLAFSKRVKKKRNFGGNFIDYFDGRFKKNVRVLVICFVLELSSRICVCSCVCLYVCPYVCTLPYARVIASATRLSTAFPQPLDTAFCHT
jgi:hypothetical protein